MSRQSFGEFYHVYNRGMQKQSIFISDADRFRFLFLLLFLQGSNSIRNVSRAIKTSVQHQMLLIDKELKNDVLKNRTIELVAFCLMPNHFHLIIHEIEDDGIAKYMQRVQNAYAKYFNTKYDKSGHLFQGLYKSKHIADDRYLLYLSAYIHKNPTELPNRKDKEEKYYWSSFQDCVATNRFPSLLNPDIIVDRYKEEKGNMSYLKFVKTSSAKEFAIEL